MKNIKIQRYKSCIKLMMFWWFSGERVTTLIKDLGLESYFLIFCKYIQDTHIV